MVGVAQPSQSELLFEELDALDYSEVVERWKSKRERVGRLGSQIPGSLFMSFNRALSGDHYHGASPLVEQLQPRNLRGEKINGAPARRHNLTYSRLGL